MPELAGKSGAEIVRARERRGFVRARQKGSHFILQKSTPEGIVRCVVPMHREVAVGTLRNVLRQARVTVEEFLASV